MIKLFEIPIYALSPSKLKNRVSKCILNLKNALTHLDDSTVARIIERKTFPMRSWDYNHVVGYIRISASKTDILFDVFLPIPVPERYIWYTTKKLYFQDICANGTHIYHGNLKTNKEIHKAISDMLDQVVANHIPSRFYVDREAFNAINEHIDYLSIL